MSARIQYGQKERGDEDSDAEDCRGPQAEGNYLPLSREEARKGYEVSNGVVGRPNNCE